MNYGSVNKCINLLLIFILWVHGLYAYSIDIENDFQQQKSPLVKTDTLDLPYPFQTQTGRLYLENPNNIKDSIKYDSKTGNVIISKTIHNYLLSYPTYKTSKEYSDEVLRQKIKQYFREKNDAIIPKKRSAKRKRTPLLPPFQIKNKLFESIFGGNTIELVPKGSLSASLGAMYQYIENPQISEENRGNWSLDFQQRIQVSMSGKIGTRLPLNFSYDTQSLFDFENIFKINYQGKEDDIIKDIKLGNVAMQVNNSLITGSQSLFGAKLDLQFGRLTISTVFSQQKSQTQSVSTEGGGTMNEFEFKATEYELLKHFFLAQYFFKNYDEALEKYPFINSEINITKIEVWVTNRASGVENARNIIALSDLGENHVDKNPPPNNDSNTKLDIDKMGNLLRDRTQATQELDKLGFKNANDYIQLENARKLDDREFTFHEKLGYISLNRNLSDNDILAVAFQYSYRGKIYQVGEFSTDGVEASDNLIVKLLKGNVIDTKHHTWDLMMKNIYSLNTYDLQKEDFILNILYEDAKIGMPINYFTEGRLKDKALLQVFNFDRLSKNGEANSDGYFDFEPNITISAQNGKIIFTSVHPFGKYLEDKFRDKDIAQRYVFKELYSLTKSQAEQKSKLNKFIIKGKYKSSSSSGISVGAMNVPRGSVKVTSMGRTLVEGSDYIVDYQMGIVKIINESIIASKAPVDVSLENNSAFGIQNKSFMGVNLAYKFSDDLLLEGTIMNLSERPLTQKMSYGQEYINNTIVGLNGKYSSELPILTDIANMFTFNELKASSKLFVNGEWAYFIPGTNGAIDERIHIDDFEGSQSSLNMKSYRMWYLASTPGGTGQTDFPQANVQGVASNYNRAKLAWYTIDPLFYRNSYSTPKHIVNDKSSISHNDVRPVYHREISPKKDLLPGQMTTLPTLDLAFYPNERGPYNVDASSIDDNGKLKNPENKWGGIMRSLSTTNFERSNIEYIQFWLLDPFDGNNSHKGGDLYFHLGNLSEDVLKDSRKSFENGLPKDGSNTKSIFTDIAKIPKEQSLIYSFTNLNSDRKNQDVGLDGLSDASEKSFEIYNNFLNNIPVKARDIMSKDPAGDNFKFFRSSIFDNQKASILERYKDFNGLEGNSPTLTMSKESYATSSTTIPNTEDIDRDKALNMVENYFQYKMSLKPNMKIGVQKYLRDIRISDVTLPNGSKKKVKWYQFKIPLKSYEKRIGSASGFTNVRFFRVVLKKFYTPTVLRFGKLEFVRSTWRRFDKDLQDENTDKPIDLNSKTEFDINEVNLEENENREPIPYKLPPSVQRSEVYNNNTLQKQNEKSLAMRIHKLKEGDSRAIYKTTSLDLRRYKKMNMYIHTEAFDKSEALNDDELYFFIRVGSDQTLNYYEYKIPLKITPFGTKSAYEIWPKENELDIHFDVFEKVKLYRNKALRNKTHKIFNRFTIKEGNREITIKGNPTNSKVEMIMMGIQNPKGSLNGDKSVEVWVNELYLHDINREGGWASNLSLKTNLSELADISFDGSISTVGFAALNKKISEQSIEDVKRYNFTTTVNIGKIFPKKWGIKAPMYYSISEQFKTPEYNPMVKDLQTTKSLENIENTNDRDSIMNLIQDYTKRMSINFVNIRKQRSNKSKAYLWDIENLSFSYSYNEIFKRNIDTEFNVKTTTKGNINYNYSFGKSSIKPFDFDFLKYSKYFDIIRNTKFNFLPNNISLRTDFMRDYDTEKFRSLEKPFT